ncbi:MAG: GNAT family N-acetyltransferase [Ilumatobacteraceae bacterium]
MTTVEMANRGDVESLVELEALLFAEDAGMHDPHADVTWPLREGTADFQRLLLDDRSVVLVARRDGEVVGHVVGYTASSSPTRQPVILGVLRSMYVRRDARRAGVGHRLTEAFTDWARDQGCVELCVDSFFENAAASRLYGRSGFAPRSVAHVLRL